MRRTFSLLILAITFSIGTSAFAGSVSRATFTIGIDNREPVLSVDSISPGSYTSISFFTELTGLEGQTVTHQWMYGGKVMFEKTFDVKAPRWRVWTSKTFIPDWIGVWTVHVLDQNGDILSSKSFQYQ